MKRWQMRRNCALTPKQLLQFYIVLVCLSLIVATGFFLAGIWMIPIFTALELSAVTIGFFVYCQSGLRVELGQFIRHEQQLALIKQVRASLGCSASTMG